MEMPIISTIIHFVARESPSQYNKKMSYKIWKVKNSFISIWRLYGYHRETKTIYIIRTKEGYQHYWNEDYHIFPCVR